MEEGTLVLTGGGVEVGGISFGGVNGLRARVFVFLALGGVVAGASAMKALSLTDAFGSFGGGKFRQGDGVDVHGIRIRRGSRGGRV